MNYNEALIALQRAQHSSWSWGNQSIHDGITQAIEVFTRMKLDLDASQPVNVGGQVTVCDECGRETVAKRLCDYCERGY